MWIFQVIDSNLKEYKKNRNYYIFVYELYIVDKVIESWCVNIYHYVVNSLNIVILIITTN